MSGDWRQRIALIGGTGGGALLTMAWMAWAGRQLGPAASSDFYGAVFLIFAVYMLGHPLNGVAARFAAMWQAEGRPERVWPMYVGLLRGLWLSGAAAALLLAPTLAWQAEVMRFREPWALGFGELAAWLALSVSAGRGVLRGLGRLTAFAGNVLVEAATRLAVGGVALLFIANATVAMAAYVVAGLVSWALAEGLVRRALPDRSAAPPPRAELLAYAAPMLVMALADAAYQNLDVLLVKRQFTAEVAGRYGAVATLTRALGVLVQPFALMVIPLLTAAHTRGERVGRTLAGLTGAFLALAAVPVVLFVLWPAQILSLIYGAAFADAAPWMAAHAIASLATFLSLMLAQAFAAVARFSFLWLYAAGALGLAVLLGLGAPDPGTLIWRMLWLKLAVLVGTAVWWWRGRGALNPPT